MAQEPLDMGIYKIKAHFRAYMIQLISKNDEEEKLEQKQVTMNTNCTKMNGGKKKNY